MGKRFNELVAARGWVLAAVADAAAGDGVEHLGLQDLVVGNGEDVFGEDGNVGEASGCEGTFGSFFESGVGIGGGVGAEGFEAGEALGGIEGCTVFEAAGDGGVEAGEGVDVFDGGIGAVGDDCAGIEEFAPDVSALLGAGGSEAGEDIGGVGGAMDTLHGGDDAELGEAGDIGRVDVLGVFDAPAEVAA